MLMNTVFKYMLPPLVIALGGLGVTSYIQTKKVWSLEAETVELKQDIKSFKEGAALAQKLRTDNEILKQTAERLTKELKDVEGYENKLPDDIIDFLERMRIERCNGRTEGCAR